MCYNKWMQLRCYLMRYALGNEVIRWFNDDGRPWIRQVFKMKVETGELEYTGNDPTALLYVPGLEPLIAEGKVEEL